MRNTHCGAWWCATVTACIGGTLLLGAPVARADLLQGTVFKVEARTASGGRVAEPIVVDASELTDEGGGLYSWSPMWALPLEDQYGEIATLNNAFIMYVSDPKGFGTFDITSQVAGENIILTITYALLTTPALSPAQGGASASLNLSDVIGSSPGATIAGQYAGPACFIANYNGMAPGGTNFASLIDGIDIPGGSFGVSQDYPVGEPYASIATPVVDMSMQFMFSLTPGDNATGNASYEIIPEPAAGLLAVGLLALLRRR
jgi:MYXO-CTERM domain-containing protein